MKHCRWTAAFTSWCGVCRLHIAFTLHSVPAHHVFVILIFLVLASLTVFCCVRLVCTTTVLQQLFPLGFCSGFGTSGPDDPQILLFVSGFRPWVCACKALLSSKKALIRRHSTPLSSTESATIERLTRMITIGLKGAQSHLSKRPKQHA